MNNTADFLSKSYFAVAGASSSPDKYGYKVFVALKNSGRTVYPLNPKAETIAGVQAFASLESLPETPEALSIVTPPMVTRALMKEAISAGVTHVWMQPGAEDEEASRLAREAGLHVIDDGSCILVALAMDKS